MKFQKLAVAGLAGLTSVAAAGAITFATIVPVAAAEAEENLSVFGRVAQILNINETDLDNAFKQAHEEGYRMPGGRGGRGFGEGVKMNMKEHMQEVAEYLELSLSDIHSAHQEGKSLAMIAEEQGKSVDGLKELIKNKMITRINESNLSDERKEDLLAGVDEKVDDIINNTDFPRGGRKDGNGFGGRGMRGGNGDGQGMGGYRAEDSI